MKKKAGATKEPRLLKNDFVLIGRRRNPTSDPNMWAKKKVDDLKELLLPLTSEEKNYLGQCKLARAEFKNIDEDVLVKTLMLAGMGKGSSLSFDGMIDMIISKNLTLVTPLKFDPDQSEFISRAKIKLPSSSGDTSDSSSSSKLKLVSAGPGSGKTTTMAKYACELAKHFPDACILYCQFNVAAEKSSITRIEMFDGKVKKSNADFNPWKPEPGIYCLTFNKLAYRIGDVADAFKSEGGDTRRKIDGEDDDNDINNQLLSELAATEEESSNDNDEQPGMVNIKQSSLEDASVTTKSQPSNKFSAGASAAAAELSDQIPIASKILQTRPMKNWDYVLIDEVQDVHGKLEDFANQLKSCAKRQTVLAGDPRQEIYPGARFFSDLWTTSSDEQKFILKYNHRSHPDIVHALNIYSSYCFKTLHHEQGALRLSTTPLTPLLVEKSGDGSSGKGKEESKEKKSSNEDSSQVKIFSKSMKSSLREQMGLSVAAPASSALVDISSSSSTASASSSSAALANISSSQPSRGVGIRSEHQGPQVMMCSRQDISACIAAELMKYNPTDVYILAPITVKKFGLETVFKGVKNCLVENGCIVPLSILADESKYNPADQVYYCGGARKLKGTERKVGILVGAEIPYTDYGIDTSEYLKALYVCISRPIEKLILIFPDDVKIDERSPIAQVIKCDKSTSFSFQRPTGMVERRLLSNVRVKDDISPAKSVGALTRPHTPRKDKREKKEKKEKKSSKKGKSDKEDEENKSTSSPPPSPPPSSSSSSSGGMGALGPQLQALRIKHNEDFVGLYIEAKLALKLGADVSAWTAIVQKPESNIRFLDRKETLMHHSAANFIETLEDGTYRLLLRNTETREQTDAQIAELKDCIENGNDLAYVLCVLNYTSQIGKWWLASKEVFIAAQTIKKELNSVIDMLPDYLGIPVAAPADKETKVSKPIWGRRVTGTVKCDRSKKTSCEIVGIVDLVAYQTPPGKEERRGKEEINEEIKNDNNPLSLALGGKGERQRPLLIEVKYAQHKEAHIRQTAVYSTLMGGMDAILVNLLEGTTFRVLPADKGEVDRYCRIHLAIKNGKSSNLGKRIRVDNIAGAVLIGLDVESNGYPPYAPLLEVGSAAWYWGTEEIEGTFCQLADGVLEQGYNNGVDDVITTTSHEIIPKLTGLAATKQSDSSGSQKELKLKVKNWIKKLHGRKIGLCWGADDFFAAGIRVAGKKGCKIEDEDCLLSTVIDLRQIYMQWLALNGISRKASTTLKDAVEHLCPDFAIRYHAAFDDVVGTIFVANCILEFAGTL